MRMIICAMREDSDNFAAPRRGVRSVPDAEETERECVCVFVLVPIIVVVRCPGRHGLVLTPLLASSPGQGSVGGFERPADLQGL